MKGKRWTQNEDFSLQENLETLTKRRAKLLFPGRTWKAIRRRMEEKGLTLMRATQGGLSYTPTQAANYLGVEGYQVRNWMKMGLFQSVQTMPSLEGRKMKYHAIPTVVVEDFSRDYPMLVGDEVDEWCSSTEAARMMRASLGHVQNMARQGRLPGRLVSARWYFLKDEVQRYIAGVARRAA